MHLRCWFARKLSQFMRFCGVKFLAWKSGCVIFLTNSMSALRAFLWVIYWESSNKKRESTAGLCSFPKRPLQQPTLCFQPIGPPKTETTYSHRGFVMAGPLQLSLGAFPFLWTMCMEFAVKGRYLDILGAVENETNIFPLVIFIIIFLHSYV